LQPACATIFGESIDFSDEPFGLVCVGIEVVADPFGKFGVAFARRVLDGFEQFGVGPRAA
jgi:hypothetical protein